MNNKIIPSSNELNVLNKNFKKNNRLEQPPAQQHFPISPADTWLTLKMAKSINARAVTSTAKGLYHFLELVSAAC